ncbi:MAG: hypothetical protein ABJE10_02710 [bacterium]
MPLPLTIRLKRHSDGSASLTLTRADGTVTWQQREIPDEAPWWN